MSEGKMKKFGAFIFAVIISTVFLFPVCRAGADKAKNKPEERAVASARNWLKIADSGKYGEAWDKASAYLKGAVSRENFTASLEGVIKPLGRVLKRSLLSATYTKTLPGAPDSEYVVIQFKTEFENKEEAVETVTPKKEKDGRWKVSGYFIK
jgi:hypothetical protein